MVVCLVIIIFFYFFLERCPSELGCACQKQIILSHVTHSKREWEKNKVFSGMSSTQTEHRSQSKQRGQKWLHNGLGPVWKILTVVLKVFRSEMVMGLGLASV